VASVKQKVPIILEIVREKSVILHIVTNNILTMNKWTELSIEYANQRSYLDDLFQVYPTVSALALRNYLYQI